MVRYETSRHAALRYVTLHYVTLLWVIFHVSALESRLMSRWDVQKYAREAYDMGIRYIGACCGFEPYHVRAIAEEVPKTSLFSILYVGHFFFWLSTFIPRLEIGRQASAHRNVFVFSFGFSKAPVVLFFSDDLRLNWYCCSSWSNDCTRPHKLSAFIQIEFK